MKIRRCFLRPGHKSPSNSSNGHAAKVMTSDTNEWYNHQGVLMNNAQTQAKVEEATKRHQQWSKEMGLPWRQIKSAMKYMPTLDYLKSETDLYNEFKVLHKKGLLGVQA
jgi:hypothetical protein